MESPIASPLGPLTDADWIRLEAFLDERANLDVEGTMGLFCAIAVAPGTIAPSTWLEILLAEDAFDDLEEAGNMLALIMGMLNETIAMVRAGEPLVPVADCVPECVSFAKGFLAGVIADPQWGPHEERYEYAAWAELLVFDPNIDASVERRPREEEAEALRPKIRGDLAGLVMEAYEAFLPLRGAPPAPVRRATTVGRNDPCPCGSGKKFKKCCAP